MGDGMEVWKEYEPSKQIDEISMESFRSNIRVECFTDSGVPVLNDSNLVGLKLNKDKFNYVTEEKAASLGKANIKFVNLWNIIVWSSDSSSIDSEITNDVYFWYILLKLRQNEIFDSQAGSAQPHIYPQHISVMPIAELDFDKISLFTEQVTPLCEQISTNQQLIVFMIHYYQS